MTIRSWSVISLVLFLAGSARADSLIEHKTLMTETPVKSWTSGNKQRTVMVLPMVGKRVSITRVDKGVVWDLDPQNKTYTERPIALPYMKDDAMPKGKAGRMDDDDDGPPDTSCTAEVKPLKKTRTIGGLSSTGYRMACKESPGEATLLWISAHTPITEKVMKEQEAYSRAYSKALFANYPPKERNEMAGGLSAFAGLMAAMPRMVSGGALPKGMWTAIEMESKEGRQTMFELVRASVDPVKAGLFDIPSGFTKVKDNAMNMDFSPMKQEAGQAAKESMKEEMKKEGMGALFKGLKKAAGQ